MQGEDGSVRAGSANLAIEVLLGPLGEPFRLVLGQVGLHGKFSLWQIQRALEVKRLLHDASAEN